MEKNKEIEQFQKEKQNLLAKLQLLENNKGQMITRLAELQGIIGYLENIKEAKEKDGK